MLTAKNATGPCIKIELKYCKSDKKNNFQPAKLSQIPESKNVRKE